MLFHIISYESLLSKLGSNGNQLDRVFSSFSAFFHSNSPNRGGDGTSTPTVDDSDSSVEFLEEDDDDVMEEDDVISLPAGHRRSPLKNGDICRWRGEGSGDEGEAAAAGLKRKAERRLEQGAEKKRRQNEREPGTWV
jgi:hypothetical protein